MKKIIKLIIALVLLCPSVIHAACVADGGDWICDTDDTTLAQVQTCINEADAGDTVTLDSGAATWSGTLLISKGIILQGAGIGNTVITGNLSGVDDDTDDPNNFLIAYQPASPGDNDFRLTGFTLDMDGKSHGILLINSSTTPEEDARVDHCNIVNATLESYTARGIQVSGTIYGVIDNNTFSNNEKCVDFTGIGPNGLDSWANLTFTYGSVNNLYVEDNTFATSWGAIHSTGAGGRYVIRFNAYTSTINSSSATWYDAHGNQDGGSYATMGVEVYENTLTQSANRDVKILYHRGGKGIAFNNDATTTGTVSIDVKEEYDDATYPTENAYEQHVTSAYYWNNTKNESTAVDGAIGGDWFYLSVTPNDPAVLVEDREFWNENSEFTPGSDTTLSTGIGIGTKAQMDIVTTCAEGVGFWVTDEGEWDTESAGYDGRLYRCNDSNTWVLYYTPYTYPHPLRGEDGLSTKHKGISGNFSTGGG